MTNDVCLSQNGAILTECEPCQELVHGWNRSRIAMSKRPSARSRHKSPGSATIHSTHAKNWAGTTLASMLNMPSGNFSHEYSSIHFEGANSNDKWELTSAALRDLGLLSMCPQSSSRNSSTKSLSSFLHFEWQRSIFVSRFQRQNERTEMRRSQCVKISQA